MAQVVIQPSYGSAEARKHWERTLKTKVAFADGELKDELTDEQLAALMVIHPEGVARFWGATPNHDRRMSMLRPGDVILFTGQKLVRGVGEVGHSFRNAAFANALWNPHPTNGSFHNVYSLLTFQHVHIPYEEIWALPSFNPGDMFMGLRFLDEGKGEEVLAGLAIETFVAGQFANKQEQMVESALAGGTVIPAEAVNATHTSYDKAGGTVLVHRAEALLVKEYIESLNLDAGQRFKTPDGGIADLYIEGDEGVEIIEAKRGADRQFVRQTLSQLLDYAPHSPKPADRLTALFPSEPASSSIELLHRYGVDCVYRTAPGAFTRLAASDDIRFYLQQRWTAVI